MHNREKRDMDICEVSKGPVRVAGSLIRRYADLIQEGEEIPFYYRFRGDKEFNRGTMRMF